MKKLTIIALALCLAVVMAAPVMAVDADFSGAYRVRGFYTSHWDLSDKSASTDFMDMRFRLQTVFKATDNLSVTTRFDALEKNFGDDDLGGAPGADNIDFDRAYMTIKSGFGQFDIGRMAGGAWGTTFVDNEAEFDRIKYTKVMDNMTLLAVYQKNVENDFVTGAADTVGSSTSDEDSETYYLLGKYKMENITSGLLLAFTNDKDTAVETRHEYCAIPYFVGKFGPLAIQGELSYKWGQTEYDTTALAGAAADGDGTTQDIDIKKLAYNLEASYNFGAGSVMAGYAFISGDDDADANEDSSYGGVGDDWEKLFILTYDETPVNVLGGAANLSAAGDYGAKILYGGVNTMPIENLTLGLVVGMADADKTTIANQEDDFGVEYDLTLNWKIYDNLTYTAIAAHLDAGDLWKGGSSTKQIEDTYALFHQLQLTF